MKSTFSRMIPFGKVVRKLLISRMVHFSPAGVRRLSEAAGENTRLGEPFQQMSTQSPVENGDVQPKKKQFLNVHPVMAEKIKTRSVLAVSGPDSIKFLNNLTTNDLSQLKSETTCLHTFFLNAKGKIIHDALIYRPDEDDTLFVECDIASLQALQTHLIMFRSKTNVEIRDVEQEVGVWSVFDSKELDDSGRPGSDDKHDTSFLEDLELGDDILLSRDPRMWPLGVRVLAPKDIDLCSAMRSAGVQISDAPNGMYKCVRYRLGVAEGKAEIGFGRSLPIEINGDYTNAISQTKSNYTGWSPGGFNKNVEYRMLPLKFLGNTSMLPVNSEITDRKGKKRSPIGFLRGLQNSYGLGLMHVASVLADPSCFVGKIPAECLRPLWWKSEVDKSQTADGLKKVLSQ